LHADNTGSDLYYRENGEPLSKGEIKRREKEKAKEEKRIAREAKDAEERIAREALDVVGPWFQLLSSNGGIELWLRSNRTTRLTPMENYL
jgi:hypothetical protein